jgi:hypothetical protein
MSLRVKKGQRITAQHNNQIVDTICSLNKDIELFGDKLEDTYNSESLQIPAFSLCWIQANTDTLALYWNSQDNRDNIVFYNNKPAEYTPFTTVTVAGADFNIPGEICGGGVPNAYYELFCSYSIGSEGESNCESGCEKEEFKGPQVTVFVDKEVLSAAYTLDDKSHIDLCQYYIVASVPLGMYSNYGFKQLHEGLIFIDDNTVITDTQISSLELSSVDIRYWQNPETLDEEPYVTLFDSDKAFEDPLQRMKKELKGVKQEAKLRTLLFICTDGSPNDAETDNSCESDESNNENINTYGENDPESSKNVPGTKLAYGKAEEYYILNDLSGIEDYKFVTPKDIATYCDLAIGANKCSQYYSTLYFENPLKEKVTYEQDACGNTKISGDVSPGEYVLTISADEVDECGNIIPPDPNKPVDPKGIKSVFKQYIPYTICTEYDEDYLCISLDKHEYTIIGPEMDFERFNPCAKSPCEECGVVTQTNIEGFTFNKELNVWCLSLTEHLSSGCYIQLNDWKIDGPEMTLEFIDPCAESPQTVGFAYIPENHAWNLTLPQPLENGCYIKINDWKIEGPEMVIGKVGNDTVSQFCYDETSHKWTLDIQTTPLSAGCFIEIENNEINGPNMVFKTIDVCAENQTNRIEYNEQNHEWEFYLNQTDAEPGCYIQINDGKIDGPNIKVERGCELKADYNPHEWTITIPENVSDLSAGCYIKIENNNINGPNIVFKQHGCDGNTTTNGTASYDNATHTWTLDVNTEGTLEAGCYIQINDSKIDGPAIEVTTGCELKADYTTHKWTITIPENISDLSAGNYITITNNNINGAKIEIDNSCGKIPGTANYSNGIWTLSFNKSDSDDDITIEAGDGIDVNVDGNKYTITNTAIQEAIDIQGVCGEICVQKNGNTYTIGLDGEHENVIYDFDPEWFTVENNYVSINKSAIQSVADSICVTTEVNANFGMTLARTNNPGRGGWGYINSTINGVTYDVDADTVNANANVSWNLDEANPNQQGNTTDYPFGWE